MPLARRVIDASEEDVLLVKRLFREWDHPSESGEPIIIEEADNARLRPVHLYVIWSEWAGLSQIDRSKIVMDAYERLRGRDMALSVSVAMGLTPEEATKLGIAYQSLDEGAS